MVLLCYDKEYLVLMIKIIEKDMFLFVLAYQNLVYMVFIYLSANYFAKCAANLFRNTNAIQNSP